MLNLKLASNVTKKRLKAYLFGETGTGKTRCALLMPRPLLFIDTEGGTTHYVNQFDPFYLEKTSDFKKIESIVDELLENPQGLKTLVLDSISVINDGLLSKVEARLRLLTGDQFYTLQPSDQKYIKAEFRRFANKLMALDLNVIVTARSQDEYAKDTTAYMKVTGTKAEGPKVFPYIFDTNIEMKLEGKQFYAYVRKDRTGWFPGAFEFTYDNIRNYVGVEQLERESDAFVQKEQFNTVLERNYDIEFNGNKIKTAGVTANTLKKLQTLVETVGEDKIMEALKTDYYINSLLDLKEDEAELLLQTFIGKKD